MTQFMLCVRDPLKTATSFECCPIAVDDAFLADAKRALFPAHTTDVCVPRIDGSSVSDVFTEAHNVLYNGRNFNTTALARLLTEITTACVSLAIWWGEDWSDLPVVTSEAALRNELEKQLSERVGDVYLRWNKER